MVIKNEYRLRKEIIHVTRIVANQGLVRSSDGNISIRIDQDRFLITPQAVFIKCPWNRMIP
jgi:ribulose-5-phosphate 4-epimerase/fuculose-1-phosphate aldolase